MIPYLLAGGGLVALGVAARYGRRRWRTVRRDLLERRMPAFVRRDVPESELGVPVFTYHSIAGPNTPDSVSLADFERQMRYLAENAYHTLSADDLVTHLATGAPVPPRSVVLTFDDGRATVWTLAYPILKRYGLRAVAFVSPGLMRGEGVRPNLEDYVAGRSVTLAQLQNADLGKRADASAPPTFTWDEANVMQSSGLVDVQSHTLDHSLVFFSPRVLDFYQGASPSHFGGQDVPVVRAGGADVRGELALGTPLYESRPRMGPARRFLDDEELRAFCVAHVASQGGVAFFRHPGWRAELLDLVAAYRREHAVAEAYESEAEQERAIRDSLVTSKRLIEEHLPGHVVRHLCFPWHRTSVQALALARDVGYVSTFADINSQKPVPRWNDAYVVQRELPTNVYGDDPFQITRIDARAGLLLSLPGKGRISWTRRVWSRFWRVSARGVGR